jgi:hypothetical protein
MRIALNQFRSRHHRRLAALLLVLALCWLVVAAHSAVADRHMGDGIAACLAVAQTAALALAVAIVTVASVTATMSRWAWPRADAPLRVRASRSQPRPRSRAGPAALQVFRC